MKTVHKSVLVWHSAQRMFDLVTDVGSYALFLPSCDKAHVINQSAQGMQASVHLRLAGLSSCFSTRNVHHCENGVYRIHMTLLEGPFQHLQGTWTFTPIAIPVTATPVTAPDACKVELHLEYQFKHALLAGAVAKAFDKLASHLVAAFVERAKALYGPGIHASSPSPLSHHH
jgi:ribosome-associated toxin RatA of RatAB toxin-antitoxin module